MADPDDKERSDNLRAEYAVLGKHIGPTSIIRFATLTAFFGLNGALVTTISVSRGNISFPLVSFLGIVANAFLLLIELRTINAHQTISQRGIDLEKMLSIHNGIFTTTVDRKSWHPSHGFIFKSVYTLSVIGWALAFTKYMRWV